MRTTSRSSQPPVSHGVGDHRTIRPTAERCPDERPVAERGRRPIEIQPEASPRPREHCGRGLRCVGPSLEADRPAAPVSPVVWLAKPAVRSRVVMVDGYVRSSPPTGWTTSPAVVQGALIRACAVRRGWRVRCLVEEPSSARLGDPCSLLRDVVARVESGESDGVVVGRLRHLGHCLEEAVCALERIEAAGGRFVSVSDGIDLGTASGRLVLRTLLSALAW